jgi:hypothetical protein
MLNNFFVAASAWGQEPQNVSRYFNQVRTPLMEQLAVEEKAAFASGNKEQIQKYLGRERAFKGLDLEQANRLRGIKYDKWTPFPNIVANYLYTLTPKDRRGTLKEDGYLDELYTMAANVFAPMPEEARAVKIEQFATFMAGHAELKSSTHEIEAHVLQKIAQMQQNPWSPSVLQQQPESKAIDIAHLDKGIIPTPAHTQPAL